MFKDEAELHRGFVPNETLGTRMINLKSSADKQ